MRNVLVVDYAGRGHAFADLFVRTNPDVTAHYAPGCAAITEERIVAVPGLTLADPRPIVRYAEDIGADLVLVANPSALSNGFIDAFRAAGLRTIGPDRSAARLESSKVFTKRLCRRYGIPTADYRWFDAPGPAVEHVRAVGAPVVVKANGPCFGNGVFVCETVAQAESAIGRLMVSKDFGPAGDVILVEEKLVGREMLFFALVGGASHLMLPMAVDYQRSDDANLGVMCGGMGAFSPSPDETPESVARFERQILRPLLDAIQSEGLDYTGVIYVGCFLIGDQLHLIEINARMGDPEAEVVLPRITTDFTDVCADVLANRLDRQPPLALRDGYLVDVVATQGPTRRDGGHCGATYPGWPYGEFGRHYPVTGLENVDPDRCRVFHGTTLVLPDLGLVTNGGKCLHLVGRGDSLEEAAERSYQAIAEIDFNGIRYRTDIGKVMPWD
jgi:phosphoribosylamine--glycine ligase